MNLYTALITPLDLHRHVDFDSLKSLVDLQADAGNGILLLGSTGEGLNLPLDTKKRLVEFVLSNKPDVPVMIGVGGSQLDAQLSWIEFCTRLGADSFLLVTPYYSKPGPKGQVNWFKSLAAATDKACMLYNIPSRAGTSLQCEALSELSAIKNITSLKEASGSIDEFEKFKACAPDLDIYCGNDHLTYELCSRGAKGLIGVMSNVYPKLTRRYVEESLSKKRSTLVDTCETCSKNVNTQNPLAAKALLYKKGIIESDLLMPPLSIEDLNDSESFHEADKALSTLEAEIVLEGVSAQQE